MIKTQGYAVKCPTPREYCTGGLYRVIPAFGDLAKMHTTHKASYKCYVRYLVQVRGYTRIGPHMYRPPDGGPVMSVGRPGNFGDHWMGGKDGRYMPKLRNSGCILSN